MREMADELAEARWVTAEIQRLVDEGVPRRDRGLLPDERAVAGARGHARAGWVGYQVIGGPKFYERAEIKDAIQYLTFLVNPQDATAFTRIANSPRRGIGQTSLSRVIGYAAAWGSPSGTPRGRRPRPGDRGAQVARALHVHDGARCASARRRGAPVAQLLDELLEETGYKEALGPSGRSRPRAGWRTSRSWYGLRASSTPTPRRRHARRVPAADRAARGRGQDPRRRGPRDADDDAQREGPRVPDRLHDRDGGRASSRTRARSRRATSRRNAGWPTSA